MSVRLVLAMAAILGCQASASPLKPKALEPAPRPSALTVSLSAKETVQWTCVFSSSQTSTEPVKEFTDRDTIYAHVAMVGLMPGAHTLEGEWFRPKGERQAVTKVPFTSKKGEKKYLFAWLKFEVPVRPFDFFLAEERETWKLKLSVDGHALGEKEFMVWR